jgi:hypothetical protein
VQFSE